MANLQALTVAISPNGVTYFSQVMVADLIITALTNLAVPSISAQPADITISTDPNSGSSWVAQDININITGGSFSNFNPTFSSVVQGANGLFTLTLVASNVTINYSSWNESYQTEFYPPWPLNPSNQGTTNNTYTYSLGIGTFTIVVPVTFAQQANSYTVTVGTVTPTLVNLSPNIPSGSIVEQAGACFTTYVQSSTVSAVESIDFQSPLQALINNLFGTIAASGNVTTNITYSFAEGTSAMAFPNNEGITIGATGDVTWTNSNNQSTDYQSVVAGPNLSIPAMPASQDVQFYVADWDFNALYWAFYNQGLLVSTVTAADLQDPAPLQTNSYEGSSLNQLWVQYPNTTMEVVITATAAPTVTFEEVYYFGPTQLSTLQGALPSNIYSELSGLSRQVFLTQPALVTAVTNMLGGTNEAQYINLIETTTQIWGAILTHAANAAFSVNWQGALQPVFTANFSLVDFQYNFVLGTSGEVQTVQFGFQSLSDQTQASIVSSQIGTLTGQDILQLWIFTLGPAYQAQLAAMGQTGVPVPFIAGFQYLFEQATLAVNQGYVSVLADVQYKGSSATEIVAALPASASPPVKTVVGIPRVARVARA